MGAGKRKRKVAILIVGVHRSGTSALARVINLLGCALPRTLLPASVANETGYWESVPVSQLNDEILALAGSRWIGWQQFREGWSEAPAMNELKTKALAILESEFGAAQLFVLKDPRMCRLIGFWREILEDFDARPVVACPIRSPLEVAASLEKREAFPPALSHLIWLRNVLEAEFATRSMRRTFAGYDGLLNAWRPVVDRIAADLGISWPRLPEQAAAEIEAFLSSTLRHHAASVESVTGNHDLPERLRTAFAIFDRWAREQEDRSDFKALDRIRHGLDDIPGALLPIIAAGHEQMARARKLRSRIDRDANELARRDAEARTGAEQLAKVESQLAMREAEAKANAAQRTEDRSRLADAARQLALRETEASANAAQMNEVKARLAKVERNLAKRETQAEIGNARLRKATAAIELVERELDGERKKRSVLLAELDSERKKRSVLAAELDRSKADAVRWHEKAKSARRDAQRSEEELRGIHSSRTWKLVQAFDFLARRAGGILQRLRALRYVLGDKTVALVATSNLFDRDWYLTQNPDVAAHGVDPALHYVRHGAAEGRDPGPQFRTRWYLDTHVDVAAAGVNPLVHYLLHGRVEGREIAPSSATATARAARSVHPIPSEPPLAAAEPLSLARDQAPEAHWIRHKNVFRGSGQLSLELSGLILGIAPISQADADDGWMAVAGCAGTLVAFCRLSGADPRQALCCRNGYVPFDIASRLDSLDDPAARCEISFDLAATQAALADVWYDNDRDLRFRFDTGLDAAAPACVARFFQYDLSRGGALLMVGESVLDGRGVDFTDIALTNAFLPVLMTLSTPEARLLSASLLPFPSLCRGGVHYGELCAVGTEASYLENLQAVSRSLLGEMLGESAKASGFSVARVEIDLQNAIGAERIFWTDVREWLACIMRIRVVPANASAVANPKVRAHLEESLKPVNLAHRNDLAQRIAAREQGGAMILTLPPDGIPTLHALATQRLRIRSGMACSVGPFVVADNATARPQWAVFVPPMGEELLELQPASVGISFPVLTRLEPLAYDAIAADGSRIPLAVRFCELRVPHPASLIMPVAPDASGPLLRRAWSGSGTETATVSVIISSCRNAKGAFASLIESLQLQTIASRVEVIAIVDTDQAARRDAEGILQRSFPGKYRLIEQSSGASRNQGINHAAEHAAGKFLVIAGAAIALLDPRTLETLCLIADHDKVASAGCVLLQEFVVKTAHKSAFRSGGIFPSSDDKPGTTEMLFSEPDCHAVFLLATYPVAGNSSALFMARTDIWHKLRGFDATRFPDIHGDIEYGIRAIAQGYFHLCTSVVSAELYDRDFGAPYAAAALPSSLPAGDWRNIAAAASRVTALKT